MQDSPRLTLVVLDPEMAWDDAVAAQVGRWTADRGAAPRLYPGALVWCAKKPGRELRERIETWLAWQRVATEVADGVLGADFGQADRTELRTMCQDAEAAAKDEVWAGYRFVALSDAQGPVGLKTLDLGAGHASASETLSARVIGALKADAVLNESVGAGYLDRNWPPAHREVGAWPLAGLRQSFLDGSLTRLVDPDAALRRKIVEFVGSGAFGLASGAAKSGGYTRLWYREPVGPDEVTFDADVFLLTKAAAERFRERNAPLRPDTLPASRTEPSSLPAGPPTPASAPTDTEPETTLRLAGRVPPEVWNRLGTRILPKLRTGDDLSVGVEFSVRLDARLAQTVEADLRRILDDLDLANRVDIERT